MSLVSRCSKPSSSLLFTVHFIPTYSTALSIQFSFENSGFGRSVLVHLKKQPEEADIFIVLERRLMFAERTRVGATESVRGQVLPHLAQHPPLPSAGHADESIFNLQDMSGSDKLP